MEKRTKKEWVIGAALTVVGGIIFGIVMNPYFSTTVAIWDAILNVEIGVTFVILCGLFAESLLRSWREAPSHSNFNQLKPPPWDLGSWLKCIPCLSVMFGIWLWLFRERWMHPTIFFDDFVYLDCSKDLQTALKNLFVPYNEHFVVPARILTFAVVSLTTPETRAFGLAMSAIPLFLLCCALLFTFARREWRSNAAALWAVAIFAISTSYREVITWYSATLWLFPFALILLSLNLVAGGNPTTRTKRMAMATLVSMIAPFCYTLGVLAGPIATSWALFRSSGPLSRRELIWAVLPAITAVAITVAVVIALGSSTSTESYVQAGGRGIANAFEPWKAPILIAQLIMDRLVLRIIGIPGPLEEAWQYPALFLAIAGLTVWALLSIKDRRDLIPIAVVILLPYAMTIPFRTWVDYESLYGWSRYNLIPQLGLSLLFVEGMVKGRWLCRSGRVTAMQCCASLAYCCVLAALNNGLNR